MAVSKGYLSTTVNTQTTGEPTHSRQVCVNLLPEDSIIGGIAAQVNCYRVAMAVSKGYLSTTVNAQTTGEPTRSRQICVRLLPEVSIMGGNAMSVN